MSDYSSSSASHHYTTGRSLFGRAYKPGKIKVLHGGSHHSTRGPHVKSAGEAAAARRADHYESHRT